MPTPLFAIADCNNFYASCEQVFHPELIGKPIVILSNNDGCIVARNSEAKALGIKSGLPYYQVSELLEQQKVAVFSSNYTLYGDMSKRVMHLLSDFCPSGWQYSIDEMFLDLRGMGDAEELRIKGVDLVKRVTKGTGIPITIGMAPTKTLAKVACKFGKKYKGYEGCCLIHTEEQREKALKLFSIIDVWGIGYRRTDKLKYYGIHTAWDFTQKSENFIKREFSVTGLRTWKELKGESCIDVAELPEKKSICTSRSFQDEGLSRLEDLEEAVANFAASCVRKLRLQHSCCSAITVFALTSRFRFDVPSHYLNVSSTLPVPSNDLQEIVSTSVSALRKHWRKGCLYKKAGVIVWGICSDTAIQTFLFDPIDRQKQFNLSKAIDEINRKNGYNTIRTAIQGYSNKWHLKCEHLSKQYTTNLKDVIEVKA